MGRKTKLTPEVGASIVASVRAGVHKLHAAEFAGVSVDAVELWVRRGREEGAKEPYRSFASDLLAAQASYAAKMQRVITRSAQRDWKAAAWDLERRFPKIYGQHALIQISVEEQLMKVLDEAERILPRAWFVRLLAAVSGEESPADDQEK